MAVISKLLGMNIVPGKYWLELLGTLISSYDAYVPFLPSYAMQPCDASKLYDDGLGFHSHVFHDVSYVHENAFQPSFHLCEINDVSLLFP